MIETNDDFSSGAEAVNLIVLLMDGKAIQVHSHAVSVALVDMLTVFGIKFHMDVYYVDKPYVVFEIVK